MIRGLVSKFHTVPYTAKELEALGQRERDRATSRGEEKVISEDIIADIAYEDERQFRVKVLELYHNNHPTPIILTKADGIKDLFITETKYNPKKKNAIFEIVLYRRRYPDGYNDQSGYHSREKSYTQTGADDAQEGTLPQTTTTEVVCRILGKNPLQAANAMRYYLRAHKTARPLESTTNESSKKEAAWSNSAHA